MSYADRLARALETTGLVQPVSNNNAVNRAGVLCRVVPGSEGEWINAVRRLLHATETEAKESHGWAAHICRHYFLKADKQGNKALVWGWNISIQSENLPASLDVISRVLKGREAQAPRPTGEVIEMSMTGVTRPRNIPKYPGDRGAFPMTGKDAFKPPRAR